MLTSTLSNSTSSSLVLQKMKEASTENEFDSDSNKKEDVRNALTNSSIHYEDGGRNPPKKNLSTCELLSDNSQEVPKANDVRKKENLGPSQDTITPLSLQRQPKDYISSPPSPKKSKRRRFMLRQLSDDDDELD